jgi:CRP/FNR family cyclic AMP-dependent transcriptional regulator
MNSPYGLPCVESCLNCKLRSDRFFCAFSQKSLEAFDKIKHATVFPEDATIFMEGQMPRGIFVLCQGQAKLSTSSREGKTFILRIAKPGEVLGLHAVVASTAYELTAETMQPCQLDFVQREDFMRFLREHGDASLRAAQQVSRDCREAYDVIRSIGLSHSVSARVAKFLLESTAEGTPEKGSVHTKLALTHEELAQLIGTSRETISRTLAEFKRQCILELKGCNLTIHDRPALVRLGAA